MNNDAEIQAVVDNVVDYASDVLADPVYRWSDDERVSVFERIAKECLKLASLINGTEGTYPDGRCYYCGEVECKGRLTSCRRRQAEEAAGEGEVTVKAKLVVNPNPLNVVAVRGPVPTGTAAWLKALSRDQRRAIWVAIGGDPDEWDQEHPMEANDE